MFPVQSGLPDIIASLHTIFAVYMHGSRVIFYSYCDRLNLARPLKLLSIHMLQVMTKIHKLLRSSVLL